MARGTRITMTRSEADSNEGRDLINLILRMCHDGKLEIREVEELHVFLRRCPHQMNAVPFLRAITREIVADGVVDDKEAYSLKKACERVVPKEVREVVSTHLADIGLPSRGGEREPAWRSHAATAAQTEYIVDLGGPITAGLTKGEASDLIESLLERRPATPRQKMLVRFFGRLDLINSTKQDVGEWIDQHFAADERHERVWARYKIEFGQDPQSLDFESVPIDLGNRWLAGMTVEHQAPSGSQSPGNASPMPSVPRARHPRRRGQNSASWIVAIAVSVLTVAVILLTL